MPERRLRALAKARRPQWCSTVCGSCHHHGTVAPRAIVAATGRLSYNLSYTRFIADTITFRPDADASRALAVLTRDGTPISTAVRAALIEAASRKAAAAIRAEAEELAADEADRAETVQVLRDMETLRAW